jgi:hypothetical protein
MKAPAGLLATYERVYERSVGEECRRGVQERSVGEECMTGVCERSV